MIKPGMILHNKYRLERALGRGGMGLVAKAHHIHLDQPVAIKFLLPSLTKDEQTVKRFLREAQATVRLESEHVCRVFDVGTMKSGAPYIVMEYLEGMDMRQLMSQQGRIPLGVAAQLLLQACAALAEAHYLGIVHRDIKPGNLFLTTRPDGSVLLKVLDFGISKAQNAHETQLTAIQSALGTPSYMSPEQLRSTRTVDARTDIWALGIVLFELLDGDKPFQADSISALCFQVMEQPMSPLKASVPDGLSRVIARCLQKDREQRYQSVAELAADLAPYAQLPSTAASLVESISRILDPSPSKRALTSNGIAEIEVPSAILSTLSGSIGEVGVPATPAVPARRVGVVAGVAIGVVAIGLLMWVAVFGQGSSAPASPAGTGNVRPVGASAPDTPDLDQDDGYRVPMFINVFDEIDSDDNTTGTDKTDRPDTDDVKVEHGQPASADERIELHPDEIDEPSRESRKRRKKKRKRNKKRPSDKPKFHLFDSRE